MKIWTGNFCRFLLVTTFVLAAGCSSTEQKPPKPKDFKDSSEFSTKEDQEKLNELRKEIPEDVKKNNDRLGEMLKRWKDQQTAPERLREKFSDEIRKMRAEIEKRHKREREDFTRELQDKRRDFQDKQKEARDDFLSSKPKGEKRSQFMNRQGEDRDRFNADMRDHRDEFEEKIKDERKAFEDDVNDRWSEFRSEYPEYIKEYNEAKAAKEKAKELKNSPKSDMGDVNKGGNGWPSTNPDDVNR